MRARLGYKQIIKSGRRHLRSGVRGYVIIVGVIGGRAVVVGSWGERDGGWIWVRGETYGRSTIGGWNVGGLKIGKGGNWVAGT